jgi:hypothetical protein
VAISWPSDGDSDTSARLAAGHVREALTQTIDGVPRAAIENVSVYPERRRRRCVAENHRRRLEVDSRGQQMRPRGVTDVLQARRRQAGTLRDFAERGSRSLRAETRPVGRREDCILGVTIPPRRARELIGGL